MIQGGAVTFKVFVSYRREDSPGHAGRLFDRLRARFGPTSVFMDVTDIEAGVDFVEVLQRAVGSCDVLLAVIGPEWISATDRSGRRRLDDPQDFIRLEIGAALKRNVRVIPVLVQGAVMPRVEELPPDLAALVRRQAIELRDIHWNADVDDLTAVLERVLLPAPRPPQARRTGRSRRLMIAGALGAAAALAIGIATRDRWMHSLQSVGPSGAVVGEGTVPAPSQPPSGPSAPVIRELASDAGAKGETPPAAPPKEELPSVAESGSAPPTESRSKTEPAHTEPSRAESTSPSRPIASGDPATVARFGMKVADAVDSLTRAARPGAIVTDVKPGGAADDAGIRDGDLIVDVNGTRIVRRDDLGKLGAGTAVSGRVVVRLMRDNAGRTIEMTVAEPARPTEAARGSGRAPGAAPNVVGLLIQDARAALARAGFGTTSTYVEPKGNKSGVVLAQSTPSVDAQNQAFVGLQVGISPTVFVYHTPAGARAAEDLAAYLRQAMGDRVQSVRPIERTPDMSENELRYGGTGFESLAATMARAASSQLSQMYRRRIALVPTLEEKARPGTLRIVVPAPDTTSAGGSPRERPPANVPNVVGLPIAAARESLTRAGFAVEQKYVELDARAQPAQRPGHVLGQELLMAAGTNIRPSVALRVGATALIVILYGRDDEQRVAGELADYLRQWIHDPQYLVKTAKSSRADRQRGAIHYSAGELDALVAQVSAGAGPWLARRMGPAARLHKEIQTRMVPTVMVVTLPDGTLTQRP